MLEENDEVYEVKEFKANREYKDSMFRIYFSEKEKALKLYSAIKETNYNDVNQMKLTTLEQVLFLGRKNDISFLFGDRLIVFIEHQSTINKNMPIRLLEIAVIIYKIFVTDKELYGEKRTPIPTPEFYVLYNGIAPHPKEKILRLSDAFIDPVHGEQSMEIVVKVININYEVKGEILERSEDLKHYSYFVHLVRGFTAEGKELNEAIKLAVSICMKENILVEFLKKHQSEVVNLLDWDLDKCLHAQREEGREEGREERDLEIAKMMIRYGDSVEFITSRTGLSVDLVEELKKGLNRE